MDAGPPDLLYRRAAARRRSASSQGTTVSHERPPATTSRPVTWPGCTCGHPPGRAGTRPLFARYAGNRRRPHRPSPGAPAPPRTAYQLVCRAVAPHPRVAGRAHPIVPPAPAGLPSGEDWSCPPSRLRRPVAPLLRSRRTAHHRSSAPSSNQCPRPGRAPLLPTPRTAPTVLSPPRARPPRSFRPTRRSPRERAPLPPPHGPPNGPQHPTASSPRLLPTEARSPRE